LKSALTILKNCKVEILMEFDEMDLSKGFLDSSVEQTAKWVLTWNETCGYDGTKLAQIVRKLKVKMRILINCNEKMLQSLAKKANIEMKKEDMQQIVWWLKFQLGEQAEKEEEEEELAKSEGAKSSEPLKEDVPQEAAVEEEEEGEDAVKEEEVEPEEEVKKEGKKKKPDKKKKTKKEKKETKKETKKKETKKKESKGKKEKAKKGEGQTSKRKKATKKKEKATTALGKMRASHVQRKQFERSDKPKTRSMSKSQNAKAKALRQEGRKRKTVKIAIDRSKKDDRNSTKLTEKRELDKLRDAAYTKAQKNCRTCLDILEFLKELPGSNLISNVNGPKFDSKRKPNDLEAVRQAIHSKQFRNGRNFAAAVRQVITKHMKNHKAEKPLLLGIQQYFNKLWKDGKRSDNVSWPLTSDAPAVMKPITRRSKKSLTVVKPIQRRSKKRKASAVEPKSQKRKKIAPKSPKGNSNPKPPVPKPPPPTNEQNQPKITNDTPSWHPVKRKMTQDEAAGIFTLQKPAPKRQKRPNRKNRIDDEERGIDFSFLPDQPDWNEVMGDMHPDEGKVPDNQLPWLFDEKSKQALRDYMAKVKEAVDKLDITHNPRNNARFVGSKAPMQSEPPLKELDPIWSRPNLPRSKRLCRFYAKGSCTNSNCNYGHDYKLEPCRNNFENGCSDPACRFSHQGTKELFHRWLAREKTSMQNLKNKRAQQTQPKTLCLPVVDDAAPKAFSTSIFEDEIDDSDSD